MTLQGLSRRGKIAFALGIVASVFCFATAIVIYVRERDWPARYIFAGVTILSVMFRVMRRQATRRR